MHFKMKSFTKRCYTMDIEPIKSSPPPILQPSRVDNWIVKKVEKSHFAHFQKEISYFYVYKWFTEVLYIYKWRNEPGYSPPSPVYTPLIPASCVVHPGLWTFKESQESQDFADKISRIFFHHSWCFLIEEGR